MSQSPVPYELDRHTLWVYPLRQRDLIDFNTWLKYKYAKQFDDQIKLVPESERAEFVDLALNKIEDFDFQVGIGHEFLYSHIDYLVRFIKLLIRDAPAWADAKLKKLFFPNGISETSRLLLAEMQQATFCPLPPDPPQPESDSPRVESTPDENVARIFKGLAEKYGWTVDQILDLTSYQIHWMLRLLPEEIAHLEELNKLANKTRKDANSAPLPTPKAGQIQFSSPDEYFAWLAEKNAEKEKTN